MKGERLTASTPLLDIGLEVSGPERGRPLFLLHGWPDDVRTWDGVLDPLHAAGFRTYVPYLRGCGPTRFRDAATPRSGQLSALAQDLLDLATALGIDRFAVAGHDWGARAAYIASVLAPERLTHAVALSVGWGTNDPGQTLSLQQSRNYWYHWFFALERGAQAVRGDRGALARFLWHAWGPSAWITDDAFDRTASSFDNPDWADITLHSYRHRWGLAAGDPAYAALEERLQPAPPIAVPTLVIHGSVDLCNDPSTSMNREAGFSRLYDRLVIGGVGHFPTREAPTAVGAAIVRFLAR
jgi:pimeloyl-ACP methyl ester carboxylesterase